MNIEVEKVSENNGRYIYAVSLISDVETRTYTVELSEEYYKKLTEGKVTPDELVRASFEFLIEREPASQILSEFELPTIADYFHEYEETMLSRF